MLLWLQNRMVFHPTRHTKEWCALPHPRIQDVEWCLPGGERVHAWWCPTEDWDSSRGAVLYLHGTGGNLSHRGTGILRWQKALDTAVLIVDYPGYGRSTGTPTEAGCYATADAAYDWLCGTQQVPAERLVVYGGSLGCAVALELATRRPLRALALVSPFTSIPDMARQLAPVVPRRWVQVQFDNLSRIGRCRLPVFIAHGTADRLVPFAHGERLFQAANEPRQFHPLVGYDHHHSPGPDFYEAVRAFLERTAPLEQSARHPV